MTHSDECLEALQLGGLFILQKRKGFRFGMDAVLLADFADLRENARVGDFGTGTGILPLLLYGRHKGSSFDGFELQPDMADMAARTMQINHLHQVVRIHAAAVEDAPTILPENSLDGVVCNPPYGLAGATVPNPDDAKQLARHQSTDCLPAWFASAHRLLRGKGRLFMVYPARQMLLAMQAMEAAHLTPKRFRLVYPAADKPAKLVLLEAVKDAKPTLCPMPPLIVNGPDGAMTPELRRIYHLP